MTICVCPPPPNPAHTHTGQEAVDHLRGVEAAGARGERMTTGDNPTGNEGRFVYCECMTGWYTVVSSRDVSKPGGKGNPVWFDRHLPARMLLPQ